MKYSAILIVLTALISKSVFSLKLNLTAECTENHIYFCTLTNLTTNYDDPLSILNSSVPHLSELIIRNSLITWLPKQIFVQAPELRGLFMHECGLNRIQAEDFVGAKKLQKLMLQSNRLAELPEKVFSPAYALQELHLANNNIYMVHGKAFVELSQLRFLDMHLNSIHELPRGVFSDLVNLEHLDLSNNNIELIDNETFAQNLKLQTLLLSNNKFAILKSNSLEHLPHLHLLDLSYTELDELSLQSVDTLLVQGSALRGLTINKSVIKLRGNNNRLEFLHIGVKLAVKELELHGNMFESLEDFVGMLNLQKLDVSKNKLKTLRTSLSPLYLPLPSLTNLNLANNLMQNMSTDNFLMLTKLTHLDLAFNHLLRLDHRVFEPLSSLEKLYIEGNRLHRFNYEQLARSHAHLKELGLFSNDWEFPYMRAMIKFLKECGIYMPVRFNLNEVPESLSAREHRPVKSNDEGGGGGYHRNAATEVSHGRDLSGIHPYWTTRDILALITLLVVLLIMLLHIYRILQEENCFAACRSRLRGGAGHASVGGQNRPRRLAEEDSEV